MNGVILVGEGLQDAFGELLAENYKVQVVKADMTAVADAVTAMKGQLIEGVAVIAIGPPATLLLETPSVLADLSAAVLFAASPPAVPIPYDQLRLHLAFHRAESGTAMSAEQLATVKQGANADNVLVFAWVYKTANDRFLVAPADDDERDLRTIAWDRTRDFLINAFPEEPLPS